jgi:tetratricopeptide (TPR) repeat protein
MKQARIAFVVAALMVSLEATSAPKHVQAPAPGGSSSEQSETEREAVRAEIRTLDEAMDETSADLRSELDDLEKDVRAVDKASAEARVIADGAQGRVSDILGVIQAALAVLAVVIAIGAAIGFFEVKKVRQLEREAAEKMRITTKALKGAQEKLQRASASAAAIEDLGARILEKWTNGPKQFDMLATVEARGVMGSNGHALSMEIIAKCTDLDTVALVGDRILTGTATIPAKVFVDLSRFWRARLRWEKAMLRTCRALEIDGLCVAAFEEKAKIIAQEAAHRRLNPSAERPSWHGTWDLRHSVGFLEQGLVIESKKDASQMNLKQLKELHHTKGWALDEDGQFAEAEAAYRTAIEIDAQIVSAGNEQRDFVLVYNLICTLARSGEHDAALEMLKTEAHNAEIWKKAIVDSDFNCYRENAKFRERFAQILAAAEAQAGRPTG